MSGQAETINGVHEMAEQASDHVAAANEELVQANKYNSGTGFRNVVVGVLLGGACCLLFLDRYS